MPIPQAVLDEEQKAMEIHKQAYPETKEGEEVPQEEKTEESKPAEEAETTPQAPEAEAQPEETPEPEKAEPQVDELAELKAGFDKLEQKYKVLQGKYNAEVNADIESVYDENRQLREELQAYRRQPESMPDIKKSLSEKAQKALARLHQDLGQDHVEDITAIMQNMIYENISPFQQRIEDVQTSTSKTIRGSFMETLNAKCPKWREVRDNPAFSGWLSEVDVGTGRSRYELAQDRDTNNDASGLAYWYNRFLQENNIETEPSPKKPVTEPSPPKKGKEGLISPTSSPKGKVYEPQKEFIKASFIEQFSNDVIGGKYKHRPDDEKRIQKQIDDAIRERRVLVGQ